MAIWRRGKPDALLHHSDRGSQYTSEQFQRLMADHGVVCSMSRSGNVWDNAAMESFFSSLKTERTTRRIYRTRDDVKADVFDYIERFYNPKRRHSTIGYLSPMARLDMTDSEVMTSSNVDQTSSAVIRLADGLAWLPCGAPLGLSFADGDSICQTAWGSITCTKGGCSRPNPAPRGRR
jgi:hypothetical protein